MKDEIFTQASFKKMLKKQLVNGSKLVQPKPISIVLLSLTFPVWLVNEPHFYVFMSIIVYL